MHLTRRQQEIYQFLREHLPEFPYPPTLDELCARLGVKSKGSLHKQLQGLIEAGLVAPMNHQRRGIRLADTAHLPNTEDPDPEQPSADTGTLPLLGYIAAGLPIEAVPQPERIEVPAGLRSRRPCYCLRVKGDSMIEAGILDGDYIVVEQREQARNGEIVVALVDGDQATLKRIEQRPGLTRLHPANAALAPQEYHPDQIRIQGVLVGQMRRYGYN
jgi:repressor LexA